MGHKNIESNKEERSAEIEKYMCIYKEKRERERKRLYCV
jgi:hypothetical protein